MDTPQIVFLLSALECLVLCWRARSELPWFVRYMAVVLFVNSLPWHADRMPWAQTWGLAMDAATLVALLACLREAVWLPRCKMVVREFSALLSALIGTAVSAAVAFLLYAPSQPTWYHSVMAARGFVGIELALVLYVATGFMLSQGVDIPGWLTLHLCLLCAWLTVQAAVFVLNPLTGLCGRRTESWDTLGTTAYWLSSTLLVIWALALPPLLSTARKRNGEL